MAQDHDTFLHMNLQRAEIQEMKQLQVRCSGDKPSKQTLYSVDEHSDVGESQIPHYAISRGGAGHYRYLQSSLAGNIC